MTKKPLKIYVDIGWVYPIKSNFGTKTWTASTANAISKTIFYHPIFYLGLPKNPMAPPYQCHELI